MDIKEVIRCLTLSEIREEGIKILESQSRDEDRLLNLVHDYSHNPVSHKVVRIIHSYVDYVKQNVWKEF